MSDFVVTNGQTQILIPLQVKPYVHSAAHTLTGSAFSAEAGTVLFGHYNMEYLLPGSDRLRLIANHDQKTVQLLLFTHKTELLKLLPGKRSSSLVANMISRLRSYKTRVQSYTKPLSPWQEKKLQLTKECISKLNKKLKKERQLKSSNHIGQEQLRREIISIIESCRDGNRLLANNPVVSEGSLGRTLYEAHQAAQHFQFNRVYSVSTQDQMDFSDKSTHRGKENPCFVWDSELHIGHNSDELDDALRVICQAYQLNPSPELNNTPANRFVRLDSFLYKLWLDGKDLINYLTLPDKPTHQTKRHLHPNGISITQITPYYKLKGFTQHGYSTLNEMVSQITSQQIDGFEFKNIKEAKNMLSSSPNGQWAVLSRDKSVLIRLNNKLVRLHYFVQDNLFYPLPDGQDLYTLSQISKRHLYLPERVRLKLRAFASRVPVFFKTFYKRLSHFIIHDLHEEFVSHVHAGHPERDSSAKDKIVKKENDPIKYSLHDALENKGILKNGQTLEEFIRAHLKNSPYIIARENHPPSVPAYDNPLHRSFSLLRHFTSLFIDTSEQNPLIGTLALAAYFYGAGAVLAPQALEALLTKLHLSGLISGIEPVQRLAQWMSHGEISEAISASATLWQGIVAGGNLDKFFESAVEVLADDPAGIAIIASLALSLGYGLTKAIPSLQQEMGEFPLPNYAALGGKGGAAIYDTIMHPGDDWLLGTCKWLCKGGISLGKIFVAPFVEGRYYGFKAGFLSGLSKSGTFALKYSRQILAALIDLFLMALTVPLIEGSAMVLHVPFRGVTHFISKTLATLGHISVIGRALTQFAKRPSDSNFITEYRISPLYGFSSPLGQFSKKPVVNLLLNALSILCTPILQLIKNFLVLPLIDTISLSIRISLTLLNPLSRIFAYSIGNLMYHFGSVWDNSLGILFPIAAHGVTYGSNWLDNQAGKVKQLTLSAIQILRGTLYDWAFHDEDLNLHNELTDYEYYSSKPGRYEKIPHSNSHCLLHALLGETNTNVQPAPERPEEHFDSLLSANDLDRTVSCDPQSQMRHGSGLCFIPLK